MSSSASKRVSRMAFGMATVLMVATASAGIASAQAPAPMPPTGDLPPPPPPGAPGAAPVPVESFQGQAVIAQPAPAGVMLAGTDHESIIGRWGIEARRILSPNRTLGQETDCAASCPVDLNAISLRKWTTANYAYSFGLALGVGGGSSRPTPAADSQTWDTFFGIGPTGSASFLLANWQHLAVSFTPGLDFLFFLPSSKGSKTFLVNVRGVVEGEFHLGMIGLPAASVGLSTGLVASVQMNTKDTKPGASTSNATATKWLVGFTGPTSLWDLVTLAQLRYYF